MLFLIGGKGEEEWPRTNTPVLMIGLGAKFQNQTIYRRQSGGFNAAPWDSKLETEKEG